MIGFWLLVVAVPILLSLLIYVAWYTAKKRREEFALLAGRLGLSYQHDDPFDTPSLPFALFSLGERRTAENMVWGEVEWGRVRLFDYSYVIRHHNPKGPDTTSTHRFSCALGEIDADCPHLVIDREGFLSRLADHVGFRDIEFEFEEFNRAFQITAEDRRFAFAFIDARMMAWLMDEDGICRYEVVGPLLLCYTDRVKPPEYENLLEVLRRFRAHVPNVVANMYPRSSPSREALT